MEDNKSIQEFDKLILPEEDKLIGAMCYPGVIPVIFSLIVLLGQSKEKKPLRFHAFQGLALHAAFFAVWIIVFILAFLLFFVTFGLSHLVTIPLLFLLMFAYIGTSCYFGYKVFSGEEAKIPYITEFVLKNISKI